MGKSTRQKEMGTIEAGQDDQEGSLRPTDTGTAQSLRTEGPSLADILQAITTSREVLETKIDTLATDMGLLRDNHRRLAERVTTNEREMSEVSPMLTSMRSRMEEMEGKVKSLEIRAEEAENRSRRNNIRLIGVPEKTENGNVVDFLETWLREQIAPEGLSPHYALERAHRVPVRPPMAGAPPRPIIARLLHYRDRDHILA